MFHATDMHVSKVNEDRAATTCGNYFYLITTRGMAHTAFHRKEAFEQWLHERKLTLTNELPTGKRERGSSSIIGEYTRKLHMSYDAFYALASTALHNTKTLDNGDYVRCFITEEDGKIIENVLNCNLKFREVFPYAECKLIYG